MEYFLNNPLLARVGTIVVAVSIIAIGAVARLQPVPLSGEALAQTNPSAPLATEDTAVGSSELSTVVFSPPNTPPTTVPTTPRVAGAATTELQAGNSEFSVISASSTSLQSPTPDATAACSRRSVFSIGEREATQSSHPADELSWADALDYLPPYQNPFVVGRDSQTAFPWRTSTENIDSQEVTIHFSYSGASTEAAIVLGWAPGKRGEKAKRVILDGAEIGITPMRVGTLTSGWWEHMARYEDQMTFVLTPGEHSIVLEHIATPEADAAIWDFVELNVTSCD